MLRALFTWGWVVWLAYIVIVDPIAVWFGRRDHVGDEYTDTHFLAIHIPMGLRVAILAWLAYHFLIAHRTG